MARQANTEQATSSTGAKRRSFGVDTSSLAAVRPLVNTGYYAGSLINVGTTMGSGESEVNMLRIEQKTKWNKNAKKHELQEGYVIAGTFSFGAELISAKAKKELKADAPKVFGGQFYLNFTGEETEQPFVLDLDNNVNLQNFLAALDLDKVDFASQVDFDWDDDLAETSNVERAFRFRGETEEERQAELEAVMAWPELLTAMNAIVYQRKFFALVAESATGKLAQIKVVKQDNYKNPSIKENAIDRTFCGIIPYTTDCELDLGEGE